MADPVITDVEDFGDSKTPGELAGPAMTGSIRDSRCRDSVIKDEGHALWICDALGDHLISCHGKYEVDLDSQVDLAYHDISDFHPIETGMSSQDLVDHG